MKKFDRIIIGASCWSAGQVLQGRTDCLVIDRHALIGREFFETYRECVGMDDPLDSPAARKIRDELLARGKINDPQALAPLLYAELRHLTGQFRLWTEIMEIRREADGWLLAVHDVEGDGELFAGELIDCTPECISHPDFSRRNITGYRLNAIILEPGFRDWEGSGFRFRPGRNDHEFIMSLDMPPGTGWAEARKLLLDNWRKRPASRKNARICAVAGCFEYLVRENSARLDKNYHYFNSAAFPNPLAALDYAGGTTC